MFRFPNLIRNAYFLLRSATTAKALTLTLPFALYHNMYFRHQCFFGWFKNTSTAKDKIQNRVHQSEYPANSPIQDRMDIQQLTGAPGFAVAVFDGHGGWQMSQYARKHLLKALDKALKNNSSKYPDEETKIVESIKEAFNQVENEFLSVARVAFKAGFPLPARVGACALVVVVSGNKMYAANAGDSQGLVFEMKDNHLVHQKLNKKLNANSKKEQARLKALFPKETDIVICKNNNPKACYVKGRLQPTRALGDFRLKYPDFNNPQQFAKELGYQPKLAVFTGPYITHQPQIKVINLTKNHKYALIACDGLWDELTKDEVTKIVDQNLKQKTKVGEILLNAALDKAALNAQLSVAELKKVPQGDRRRKLHDDISIITIDLQGQTT